jgi:hypothetical protein
MAKMSDLESLCLEIEMRSRRNLSFRGLQHISHLLCCSFSSTFPTMLTPKKGRLVHTLDIPTNLGVKQTTASCHVAVPNLRPLIACTSRFGRSAVHCRLHIGQRTRLLGGGPCPRFQQTLYVHSSCSVLKSGTSRSPTGIAKPVL